MFSLGDLSTLKVVFCNRIAMDDSSAKPVNFTSINLWRSTPKYTLLYIKILHVEFLVPLAYTFSTYQKKLKMNFK